MTLFDNERFAVSVNEDHRYVIDQYEEPMPNPGRVELSCDDAVRMARAILGCLVPWDTL